MTQYQLIKTYILEHGSILPAKMYGQIYKGQMFGSESSKRCRELRKGRILTSVKEGKFERFYLVEQDSRYIKLPPAYDVVEPVENNQKLNI